jgi:hypothetical protein
MHFAPNYVFQILFLDRPAEPPVEEKSFRNNELEVKIFSTRYRACTGGELGIAGGVIAV